MDGYFWGAFSASVSAALVTTTGILVIRRFSDRGQRNATYFVCFAAGVLVSVPLLHMAPTAFTMTALAPAGLLAGYWTMYLFNRFITAHVCDRPIGEAAAIGLVPMLGIGFHSLIDGAIYSVTFTVSMLTGVLAAIGMVLHEFPEGIITYVLLLQSGFSERKAALFAFLAAALTTPLGMLVSFPFITGLGPGPLGILLSVSGGALLYVGATHLLPRTESGPRKYSTTAIAAGIAVAVAIEMAH